MRILHKVQVNQRVGGLTNYYELTKKAELAAYLDTHTSKELFTDIDMNDSGSIFAEIKKAQDRKNQASSMGAT